ncbi:serine hydrolase domain-containing protein [Crossiella sp. CA198]|uniref:serine hydrolase domain-containing protein n=1 Tax=Crossiella sp. CA198 TaxID=3455607 RepID=UPI003F8D1456
MTTTFAEAVAATATEFGIPGLAAGVLTGDIETFACHGVTSLDNPLPITPDTLYPVASVSKTHTATAILRLAEQGRLDLADPVRRHLPELRLADERAAATMTVRNLLNHTSGLDTHLLLDTGEGADALREYVARLPEIELIAPVGARASYSQAGYNLLGRIIERVTDQTFEQAMAELVLEPAELTTTCYSLNDVLTRRFAVGHNRGPDGTLSIARNWKGYRADNPGGGLVSSASDLLRWARYHLGDASLGRLRERTVDLRGSSLGDGLGLGWFLRGIDGVRAVGHGGSGDGQFAELLLVPERDFAVVSLSNAGPDGIPANQAILRWALEHHLGLHDRDPEPLPYEQTRAGEITGRYDSGAMTLTISATGPRLRLEVLLKPDLRARLGVTIPDHEPFDLGLLPADEYILTSGAFTGQRGCFSRDAAGRVTGVDLAGRLFSRENVGDPA